MLRRIVPLLATAFFALSHAAAIELDDLAEALRKGTETLANSAADDKKPDSTQQQRIAETLRMLTEFDQALVRGDAAAAQAAAGRLETNSILPQPLRETAGRLRRELPALLDAREDAFVATVDRLVVTTREQCLAAHKEADLQPLLREASRLDESKFNSRSPYAERAGRKIKSVVSLIRVWMDYLAAKEAGHGAQAAGALQQLAGDNTADRYPILPEAEIRRRVGEVNPNARPPAELSERLRSLLVRVQTLRDVPVLAPEIAALPHLPQNLYLSQTEQESLQRWFAEFATTTAALFSGDLGDAWKRAVTIDRIGSESWAAEAIRLRELLIGELAVKSLSLTPAQARRPNETPTDHLLRIAREAAREHRWEELEPIERLYRMVMERPPYQTVVQWWADSYDLIAAYLEGQRLEAAGDFTGAVAAYLRVLRGSGDLVPTAEAQERLRALLAAQKTTLTEVRTRLDSERLTNVMERLEASFSELKKRGDAAERAAQIKAASAPAATAAGGEDAARLDARLKKLEAAVEKLGKATTPSDEFQTRLSKVETLLAPALEADPAKPGAADGKVRLWLGPDFTVYRSAVPPAVNARLDWIVRFNGKTVLSRTAKREMQFNYDGRKPGIYTIYLTEGGENPVSNVIDYTLTEEAAKKLGPRIIDDDWDRDGARNPPAPRGQ